MNNTVYKLIYLGPRHKYSQLVCTSHAFQFPQGIGKFDSLKLLSYIVKCSNPYIVVTLFMNNFDEILKTKPFGFKQADKIDDDCKIKTLDVKHLLQQHWYDQSISETEVSRICAKYGIEFRDLSIKREEKVKENEPQEAKQKILKKFDTNKIM